MCECKTGYGNASEVVYKYEGKKLLMRVFVMDYVPERSPQPPILKDCF